jgi:hypothetical protein
MYPTRLFIDPSMHKPHDLKALRNIAVSYQVYLVDFELSHRYDPSVTKPVMGGDPNFKLPKPRHTFQTGG